MTGRPPRADELLREIVARPGKLTSTGSKAAVGEWRCPREHLLAAVVPTPHGASLYWRGSPLPMPTAGCARGGPISTRQSSVHGATVVATCGMLTPFHHGNRRRLRYADRNRH